MSKANIKQAIQLKLGKKSLYYVTRDVERAAAGLLLGISNYFVITNTSPYSLELKKIYPRNIFCIGDISSKGEAPDTLELLKSEETKKIIKKEDDILVFKNTIQIEKTCKDNDWSLLNPRAALANQVEEKISQIEWLGPLAKYLPEYKIDVCKNIVWDDNKFVLQFNRSHTGSGTILITSKKQLEEIKEKFPDREARVAEYIPGPLFTNNNIVWGNEILAGNISYQITGLQPFTDLPFATIGNDWALPHKILDTDQIKEYKKISTAVGRRLAKQGWKGLFGVDIIMNENDNKLYLLEINARQPASTTYESELQTTVILRETNNLLKQTSRDPSAATLSQDDSLTTYTVHLLALLEIPYEDQRIIPITTGAQIIQRVVSDCHLEQSREIPCTIDKNLQKNSNIIIYNNIKPGSDLFRYQFREGVMKEHNKLLNY